MRATLPSGHPAELVRPSGPTDRGLVVLPDIMGLRPLFDDLAADLATRHDRAVCVIEPWPDHLDRKLSWRLDNVGVLDDDVVLGDAMAAADLVGSPTVDIIGFCMGGMYALKAAGAGRFHRAAAFYGMAKVPPRWAGPGQGEPLDALRRPGASPTMAIIGTADTFTPPDEVAELEAAGVEVVRYEGAEHGFVHDASREAHRADDAADAWHRVFAFLDGA